MKKKFITTVISLACVLCCMFVLAGCFVGCGGDDKSKVRVSVTESEWNTEIGRFDPTRFDDFKGQHNFTVNGTSTSSLLINQINNKMSESTTTFTFDYTHKIVSTVSATSYFYPVSQPDEDGPSEVKITSYYWEGADGKIYSYMKVVSDGTTAMRLKSLAAHYDGEFNEVQYASFDELFVELLGSVLFDDDADIVIDKEYSHYELGFGGYKGTACSERYPNGTVEFTFSQGHLCKVFCEALGDAESVTHEMRFVFTPPNSVVPEEILNMKLTTAIPDDPIE